MEFFVIKKFKILCCGYMTLMGMNIVVGIFYKQELLKTIKKNLELKKSSREKAINYNSSFNCWIDKKT